MISYFIVIDYPYELFNTVPLTKRPEAVIENNKIILRPGVLLLIIRPQIMLCQALGIDYSLILEKTQNLFLAYYNFYTKSEGTRELFREPVIFASKPIDLEMVKSFNVYSDLCLPRIVGSQLKQLLRIVHVPENKVFGEQLTVTYPSPQYTRLNSNLFNKILIIIKERLKHSDEEEVDNYIPFQFGEIIVTLHFRQISYEIIESSLSTKDGTTLEAPLSRANPLDTEMKPDDTEIVVPKKDV